jgi:hypothetical protein
MNKATICFAVLLGALSSGCGGGGDGGGGGSGSGSAGTPQVQNLESAPAPAEPYSIPSVTLTATSGGDTYTATYSQTPNVGTTMFDGQEANSSSVSLTLAKNGTTLVTEVTTAYYLENPYTPLGLAGSVGGTDYEFILSSVNPLPSTLTVGASGPLGNGTYYLSGTNTAIGSLTETYSVTANDPTTVLLTTSGSGTINGQSTSETITYAVNSSGAFELQSVEILVGGMTFNLTSNCAGCWDY